jgi:hypothetical protein
MAHMRSPGLQLHFDFFGFGASLELELDEEDELLGAELAEEELELEAAGALVPLVFLGAVPLVVVFDAALSSAFG